MELFRLQLQKERGFNPKTILDVGANNGDWCEIVKGIWPDAVVFCVEANPFLKEALEKKNIPHTIALLYKEPDKLVDFYVSTDCVYSTGNSIYREDSKHFTPKTCGTFELKTETLDRLFKGKVFDFIKIDTQGSEVDILMGGVNLVKTTQMIMVESSLREYNIGGAGIGDVFDFMNKNGFLLDDVVDGMSNDNNELVQLDLLFKNTRM